MRRRPSSSSRLQLGTRGPWWRRQAVTLSLAEARAHFHVSGITGSGKSRFLAHLFLELHAAGLPATLIDPHGDLAGLILRHLVARGFYDRPDAPERLLYLDLPGAAARGRYLPFNVLRQPALAGPAIEGNVLEAMHRTWPSLGEGRAPRFDKLVQRGVRVLLSNGLPLPALERLLTDPAARARWLANEADPDTVRLFRGQFDRLSPKAQVDYADATLSRLTLLTQDPVLKYSLLQEGNLLDFRALMDAGKSVLVNLALPNPAAKRLFGSFLTVAAEQGARSRADTPAHRRGPSHHLVIDEFQLFTAQSADALTAMLSETRKYGLYAVLSHQNWSQIPERLRGGLENCRVEIVLAQGALDAEYSARLLLPVEARTLTERQGDESESVGLREQWEHGRQRLADQWQGEAYVAVHRMQKPGLVQRLLKPATPRTVKHVHLPRVPDPVADAGRVEAIEDQYLERYFTPRARVEERAVAQPTTPARLRRQGGRPPGR